MAENGTPENNDVDHDEHASPEPASLDGEREQDEATSPDASSIGVGHETREEASEESGDSAASSAIRIGTGTSGITSDDWSLPGEPGEATFDEDDDGRGGEEAEPPHPGVFELPEGMVADLETEFGAVEASAADDPSGDVDELGSEFSEFAEIDNPEMAADLIGETSQDEHPGSWDESDDIPDVGPVDGEFAAGERAFEPGGAVGVHRAPPAGGLRPRSRRRQQSAGSVWGVVVGGLLAIPIVVVILLWGFRRDDFGIAAAIPETLSFLVPTELRRPKLPQLPELAEGEALPPIPRLPLAGFRDDQLATSEGENSLADGTPAAAGTEAAEAPLAVEDPLLEAADLALVEMATARARVMLGSVNDLPDDAPETMRNTALVDWYKSLAAVGEEAVAAEKMIVEAGRSTKGVGRALRGMLAEIAENPQARQQLERLARQWMQASKRDSQGVVFPGTLRDVRQVGTVYAAGLLTEEDDRQPQQLTVLSSVRPEFPQGQRVVAVGVVVADGVLWAASLETLEAASNAEGTPQVSEE